MRTVLSILFVFLFGFVAKAQINPPQLSCIEGNGSEIEIVWSPPVAPCNAAIGYIVHFSDQLGGPYQNFTVNDPGVLDTTFATSFTEVYVYMESIMACPGETVVNSDTLIWDLRPPTITSINVNNSNQIEVNWTPSVSPDIAAYLIYIDGGNIPDTVWGLNSSIYTDLISDPATAPHTYAIAWYRDCVNDGDRRGSIGNPYNSIQLQDLQQDVCNQAFSFGWNFYENYGLGVNAYQISVSEGAGPFNPVDTLTANQLIYVFNNAVNGTAYCFKVSAMLPNGILASSNFLCDTARVIEFPSGAHVRNATVIGPGTVQIEYFPDTVGGITDLNIQRRENGTQFQTWPAANLGATGNSPDYDIYEDNNAVTSSTNYYYRFRRLDDCDGEHISDTVRTIHLDAELGFGLVGELEWSPYQLTYGTVVEYTIIKYINGDSTVLGTVNGDVLNFPDVGAVDIESLDTICYQIIAEVELDIPNFISTTVFSNSNISCLEPSPSVVAPSAFRPSSTSFLNTTFKPILIFGTDEDYIFRVYDRTGAQLFETTNPDEGWDGAIDGKVQGLDGFVYYVSFVGQDGETYNKSGFFLLMR